MKNILVVSYSQSGQLTEIVERFLQPFQDTSIEHLRLVPKQAFPFPWTTETFFDAMPETVQERPIPLQPFELKRSSYDLIVLAYQPWFLSPSLPFSSVLQDSRLLAVLKDAPVVTLIAGRNMWLNAQESVKKHLKKAGARLVGNVPLMDRVSNLISAVTILHWMLTGRKDRKWGIFPTPGVSQEDIDSASRFGAMTSEALQRGDYNSLQQNFLSTGLIEIPTDILFIEERAKKIFYIWANLIITKGTTPQKRRRLVNFFKYYLLIALFMVAPLLLSVYLVLIAPLTGRAIKKKKQYFCGLDLKE